MRIKSESSVIRKTIIFIVIQSILIAAVFGVYVNNSYRNIRNAQISSAENLVEIYGRELDNKIQYADMLLEQMIYKNDNYSMLKSSKESDRYYASVRLKEMMEEAVSANQNKVTFVIAESTYNTCLDYSNTTISYGDRDYLRSFTMEKASLGRAKADWKIEKIGMATYLYKIYVWQNEAAAVYISMNSFLGNSMEGDLSEMSLVLYEPESKVIWGIFGENPGDIKEGDRLVDITEFAPRGKEYVLGAQNYCIRAYAKETFSFKFLQLDVWAMIAIILILFTFTMFMVRHLRKSIIRPVGKLQRDMEKIQFGDYELRIADEFGSKEFNLLKNTFNKLMDEIMGLKIKTYEKQISLQETELRCVKLQIRPHFFLNAMTTISSLSQQGKNEEIRRYIDSLSKNIRYMFRSGLHTVTLDEEIRHVENYFEMQELKYPGCVFFYIDAAEDARAWNIPQMLIHTVIENEYKYAVDINSMLTILIKAEIVQKDSEEMLKVVIEDDGKGYPGDILADFRDSASSAPRDGSRVGLFSIKRILEIMYERKDLFEIDNIEPHGCKNTMYIPKVPKHEVDERGRINID